MKILLALASEDKEVWHREIIQQDDTIDVQILGQNENVRGISGAIVEPSPEVIKKILTYSDIKNFINIWAGVDEYVRLQDKLTKHNIVRAIGKGLQQGMAEYVIAMSLNISLNIYDYNQNQKRRIWHPMSNRLSSDHTIGVLGLGKMGGYVCEKLRDIGFNVRGFSRKQKTMRGIECYCGEGGLEETVRNADIVVCLLPLYEKTRGILGSKIFDLMKFGGSIINVGRGEHVNKRQLLESIKSGQINRAILDVFEREPPEQEHEFWDCERIIMTPHVASKSRIQDTVAESLRILKIMDENEGKDVSEIFGQDIVFDMNRGY